jgi:peptidyl-prolyl cis-trans isomerase C
LFNLCTIFSVLGVLIAGPVAADDPQRSILNLVCESLEDSELLTPLATRGDAVIYKEEIAAFLATMPPEHAAYFVNSDHIQKRLQQLTIERLVALDGAATGTLIDPRALARTHSVISGLLSSLKRQEIQQVQDQDALEGRARELYLANPSQFSTGSTYSFEHLLVTSRNRSDLEAASRMIDVHERLISGASFSELRQEYSEDESQPREGYTNVTLQQWPDKLKQALSNTEPTGQVIGPFSTDMGWHLVKYEGFDEGGALEWESEKEAIVEIVRKREAAAAERRYIRSISTPPYVVDDSALKDLREEFSQ